MEKRRVILVSGGNRGIGKEVCSQLAENGHQVVLGSRVYKEGEKVASEIGHKTFACQLDINSETEIVNAAELIMNRFGKLDVLINNAAVGENYFTKKAQGFRKVKHKLESNLPGIKGISKEITGAMRSAGIIEKKYRFLNVPLDRIHQVSETNLFGNWLMIQHFTPLLQKGTSPRIINVSSQMGHNFKNSGEYPAYSFSKACLNILTQFMSHELKEKGIIINAVCPGWVRTDMGGPNAPLSLKEGADSIVWLAESDETITGKFFSERKIIPW